jgi:hypothetical protein
MDLIKDVVGNLQEMIRAELRLARAETTEKAARAVKGAGMAAAGAVTALFAVAFLLLAVHYWLSVVISPIASALIIGVALGLGALVLVSIGVKRIKGISPIPERTVENVQRDVQVIKEHSR